MDIRPPRQCAWCGQVLEARDEDKQGKLFFVVNNRRVDLHRLDGYSHGSCQTCRQRNSGVWLRLRQRERAQLAWVF